MKEGIPFKEAYCLRVQDLASGAGGSDQGNGEELDDVTMNRVKLRKYLQELSHYQNTLIKKIRI